jgi:hypothetical protein
MFRCNSYWPAASSRRLKHAVGGAVTPLLPAEDSHRDRFCGIGRNREREPSAARGLAKLWLASSAAFTLGTEISRAQRFLQRFF